MFEIFANPCFLPYQKNTEYYTNSKVSYLGKNYEAAWSTREVPGVTNWGGWKEMGSCLEETVIDLSKNEEQEKSAVESLSQFLLFATQELNLNSGVKIAGNIGANEKVFVGMSAGWQTIVNGDIYSKGEVSTSAEALINGNVYAKNGLTLGWEAKHNGEVFREHDYDFNIERKNVPTSSQDISGKWREKVVLSSGNYRDVSVRDGGSLQLSKGIYNLKTLSLNSNDLEINLNILAGENIQLNIQDSIHLGSGTKVTFLGKKSPLSLKIYTNQSSDLIIPDHSEINAIITAPNAKVIVNSGAKVNGAIFAKEIEVKYGAVVNGVPYITDIFHSQYHFAPEFDIHTAEYFSVISVNENIEFVEVLSSKNYKVTQTNTGNKYLFEIEDTVSGLVSFYTLDFQKYWTNAIFVNSSSSVGNGESWASALNNLGDALKKAKETGREIRVAEGTYGNVTFGQGTKILGGYLGTEPDEKPLGSPYKTIIDGQNIGQTVIIKGFENAKSVKIKGVTVQNGKSETNGGGIFSENVVPKIEEIIIQNNVAKENGAGIFAAKGAQDLQMVLFEGNVGKSAFYLEKKDNILAERIVFSTNKGTALSAKNANIEFVNSIFYGNDTAVLAQNSQINLIHCTSTKNNVGVVSKNSNIKAVNSIFWNESGEFSGGGFEVEFSCVKGGFAGEGNISDEPMFAEVEKPRGEDGFWGSDDDGLFLKQGSPCIDKGKDIGVLEDIIETLRPTNDIFEVGAYEYYSPPKIEQPSDILGYIGADGKFYYSTTAPRIFAGIQFIEQLEFAAKTNHAKYIRIKIPKKRQTKVNSIHFEVIGLDDVNNPLDKAKKFSIWANRTGSEGDYYVFISNKPVVLIDNHRLQGEHNFCYAIFMKSKNIRYEFKHSQF